jgi:hypothetical protein
MKILHNLLTCLVISLTSTVAFADEVSHRAVASELLEHSDARTGMRAGFLSAVEPIIKNMKQQGIPDVAGEEVRKAMADWFDAEIKWEDIKPKIVELYVKEFTEDELKELLAFWRTPTGQKAMKTLPSIMQQGGAIGQAYAASKQQETLKTKIGAIIAKYRPQKP